MRHAGTLIQLLGASSSVSASRLTPKRRSSRSVNHTFSFAYARRGLYPYSDQDPQPHSNVRVRGAFVTGSGSFGDELTLAEVLGLVEREA